MPSEFQKTFGVLAVGDFMRGSDAFGFGKCLRFFLSKLLTLVLECFV